MTSKHLSLPDLRNVEHYTHVPNRRLFEAKSMVFMHTGDSKDGNDTESRNSNSMQVKPKPTRLWRSNKVCHIDNPRVEETKMHHYSQNTTENSKMATKRSSIPYRLNASCDEYIHHGRLFESRSRSMTLSCASEAEDENGKELKDASSTRVKQKKKTKPTRKARNKVSDISSLEAADGRVKYNSNNQTLKGFFAGKWNRGSYNLHQSFDFPVPEVTPLTQRRQTRRILDKEPSETFWKIDTTTEKKDVPVGELTCDGECSRQKEIRRERRGSSLMLVHETLHKILPNSHKIVYIKNCQNVQISGGD